MPTYDGYGMPAMDFSPIGNLPNDIRQAKLFQQQQDLQQNRQRTLAELAQGGNIGDVAKKLFAVGDVEGGLSLAKLADAEAARQWQRQTSPFMPTPEGGLKPRPGGSADPAYIHATTEQKKTPETVWQEDAQGNKVPFIVQPGGGGVKRATIEGEAPATGNPYALGNKATEAQSKDATYANRIAAAEQILSQPNIEAAGMSSAEHAKAAVAEKAPFGVANRIVGEDFKSYDQARRDFINATLRRESGAVINKDEFDNAYKQYLPRPDDSPAILEQKRRNRIETLKGIAGGAGQHYQAPFGIDPETSRVIPRVKTVDEVTAMVKSKKMKSGDRFMDPTGQIRTVP